MSIKVLPEADVYVTQEELERLQDEYRHAMQYYAGPAPSFGTWVKQCKARDMNSRLSPQGTTPTTQPGSADSSGKAGTEARHDDA